MAYPATTESFNERTDQSLSRIHTLLAVQSVIIILLSVNRLSTLTLGYVADNEFLRWVDFNNMLVLPLISVAAFYLLKKQIEYDTPARESGRHLVLNLIFLVGVYLLAAGYGNHEISNYLHVRFCLEDEASDLCRIIIFNDDEFSHWVFFIGFVMINTGLMLLQALFPQRSPLGSRDIMLLVVNGLFISLGIFANLAFEVIGLDLYIIALLTVLAFGLLWRYGAQPLLIYYSLANGLALVATAVYKAFFG